MGLHLLTCVRMHVEWVVHDDGGSRLSVTIASIASCGDKGDYHRALTFFLVS